MVIVISPFTSEKAVDNASGQSIIGDDIVYPRGIARVRLVHVWAIAHANQIKEEMNKKNGKRYLSAECYKGTLP